MRPPIRLRGRTRLLSPLMAAALAASLLGPLGAAAPVVASPARPAAAPATAPAAPGPATGTNCSPSCDLYARTGTATMPDGSSVPIWGYTDSSTGTATLPGPLLEVTAGTAVAITLHNVDLPSATALMIAGQPGVPDTTGVTAGNTKTYSFPASGPGALQPGTYLYEAGLTFDGPRQVALGLHGALIVRPAGAALQAYADPSTTFADEAVLVLSEVDPAFNAAPSGFDMTAFAPKYWLINGKGYPNTDSIGTAAGNAVLLRYVNAGLQTHSMSLLGLHQTIIATDGQPATNQSKVVAQTVPPGGTLDTIVAVPASAPTGTQYAVFEAAMHLDNKGASTGGVINFGGMLTFLAVSSGTTSGGSGPVTSGVSLTPNPSDGSTAVTLTATISGAPDQAEYFVDALGADGSGCAISGSVTSVSVSIPVSGATAPCVDLTTLSGGSHTFYVHGHDATNGWGAVASAVLNLDKGGPTISNMGLTPSADNGTADVALQATASDVASGNQNVTAAEYFIDSQPASNVRGTALSVPLPATTVSLSATILAATVNGLPEGNHTVAVRAQDALGNWGAFGTTTLKVDKTGPSTSGVSAQPNPNNGTLGVQIGTGGAFYVRIDATVTDPLSGGVSSNVAAAEYFFDTVGANGSGGAMVPTDGSYNSPSEAAYAAVDLIHIASLSAGTHTIYAHGKDAAGNWGATSSTTFVIDKVAPTVSGVTLTPPASNNTAVAVSATATDVATGNSNIAGGEYFVDTAGAAGTGTAMTAAAAAPATTINGTISAATVAALTTGNHTIYVRARDAAGNWSSTASATLLIDRTPPTFTGITLNPNSIPTGTASVNLTVNGASDGTGGSGVVGGEYWFGTTNITAGTGTAFTGLTNVPINTSALAAGTYTVRVRIRDAAGNWSTGTGGVRTATLTVTLVRPGVSKAFTGAVRGGNGTLAQRTTTLTITLSNSNASAITGAALTDNLPQPAAGTFTVVSSATTCGGSTSTQNTSRRLLLSSGTIPASGSCTVTATVRMSTGATNGSYTLTNTILVGGVTSTNAGTNPTAASAVLTVNP